MKIADDILQEVSSYLHSSKLSHYGFLTGHIYSFSKSFFTLLSKSPLRRSCLKVWKNTEDEVLKAAIAKYGKNQW